MGQGLAATLILMFHLDQSSHLLFIWVWARHDTQEENIGKLEMFHPTGCTLRVFDSADRLHA